MGLSDKALGAAMLLVASVVFIYYTTWAILLPFFPPSHPLHDLFPAREWAVRIPAFLVVVGVSAIGSFIGMVVVKEGKKQKAKAALKAA